MIFYTLFLCITLLSTSYAMEPSVPESDSARPSNVPQSQPIDIPKTPETSNENHAATYPLYNFSSDHFPSERGSSRSWSPNSNEKYSSTGSSSELPDWP